MDVPKVTERTSSLVRRPPSAKLREGAVGRPPLRTAPAIEMTDGPRRVQNRNVNVTHLTEDDVVHFLEKGKRLMLDRYEPGTQQQQRYMVDRFLSFEEVVLHYKPNTALSESVAAFLEFARTRNDGETMNSYNSVSTYLWLMQSGLPIYDGRELPARALEMMKRSVGKKRVPSVKANPLPYWQLIELLRNPKLRLSAKALAIALWLSTQRGSTLIDIMSAELLVTKRKSEGDAEDEITVFYLAKRKNKKLVERVDPICHQWTLGDLAPWMLHFLDTNYSETHWTEQDERELEKALKCLPVQQHHRLLRPDYSLYSLKRGALQQLGHLEKDWDKICLLSLHARLEGLAVYIGAFLNKRVQASKELTSLLSRPPATAVPPELQPVPREMRAKKPPPKVQPVTDKDLERLHEMNLDFIDHLVALQPPRYPQRERAETKYLEQEYQEIARREK